MISIICSSVQLPSVVSFIYLESSFTEETSKGKEEGFMLLWPDIAVYVPPIVSLSNTLIPVIPVPVIPRFNSTVIRFLFYVNH